MNILNFIMTSFVVFAYGACALRRTRRLLPLRAMTNRGKQYHQTSQIDPEDVEYGRHNIIKAKHPKNKKMELESLDKVNISIVRVDNAKKARNPKHVKQVEKKGLFEYEISLEDVFVNIKNARRLGKSEKSKKSSQSKSKAIDYHWNGPWAIGHHWYGGWANNYGATQGISSSLISIKSRKDSSKYDKSGKTKSGKAVDHGWYGDWGDFNHLAVPSSASSKSSKSSSTPGKGGKSAKSIDHIWNDDWWNSNHWAVPAIPASSTSSKSRKSGKSKSSKANPNPKSGKSDMSLEIHYDPTPTSAKSEKMYASLSSRVNHPAITSKPTITAFPSLSPILTSTPSREATPWPTPDTPSPIETRRGPERYEEPNKHYIGNGPPEIHIASENDDNIDEDDTAPYRSFVIVAAASVIVVIVCFSVRKCKSTYADFSKTNGMPASISIMSPTPISSTKHRIVWSGRDEMLPYYVESVTSPDQGEGEEEVHSDSEDYYGWSHAKSSF